MKAVMPAARAATPFKKTLGAVSPALLACSLLALLTAACLKEEGGDKPPVVTSDTFGTFLVSVIPPTPFSGGHTSVSGNVFDGPVANLTSYEDKLKSGDCALKATKTLACNPDCGSGSLCVDLNKCQLEPDAIGVGTVTFTGFKAAAGGAAAVAMNPTSATILNYQLPSEPRLAFPPSGEGELVTLQAAGSADAGPFSLSAKGIAPLVVPEDTLVLADGAPLNLQWTKAGVAGSRMWIEVNITNHGAHAGKISCETDDDGSLVVAGNLVDGLKALGVSGFPTVDLTRISRGTGAGTGVELVFESKVTREISIPGVISCSSDEDCPTGKTCSGLMVCQ